jgi:serine/threonine protein kinase
MGVRATGKSSSHPPPALGKFVPFARLGQGGMADVFLAVARGPVGFNKLVVVKRLRNTDDSMHLDMFLDEARLSARLSHPNIVNTYEVGEAKGQYFIAMEYLEGQPLQGLMTTKAKLGERLDETMIAFITMQALKGLHYAHELTDFDGSKLLVVHRDVSPHNLFLTYQGEVKLLDFGIAKAQSNKTHTETGVLKGKVRYMAPEQMSEKDIDRRADVWGLGVVLWEMLAGRPLYTGDVASILTRIHEDGPPSIREAREGLSPELEAIVNKSLRRDLAARYQTADEMREDLERFLRGKEGAADSALARLMNDTFAETRDAVRARIKAFVADMPSQPSGAHSTPDLAQAAEQLPTLFGDTGGSGPRMSEGAIPLVSGSVYVPNPTASTTMRSTPAPPAPGKGKWWILATAVAVAGVGVFAVRGQLAHGPAAPAPATVPAPAPPTSSPVYIESSPPGARIEWNGRTVGQAPGDVQLPAGPQTLVISLDGYQSQTLVVEVQPNAPTARAFVMRPVATPGATPSASASTGGAFARGGIGAGARFVPAPTPKPTATASTPRSKIRVVDDETQ